MRRRGFLKSLAVAAAGFTILPSATTYARQWVPRRSGILVPNPDYINARYEIHFLIMDGYPAILTDKQTGLPPQWKRINDPYPPRFRSLEDYAARRQVNPYKYVRR